MKKLLGILFAALLIMALLPVVACAESSGTCGNNLTWVLDDAGTLTISGTGAMWDYYTSPSGPNYPWSGNTLKSVVIEDGVTSIGEWAFCDCSSLTSVTIPEGVTSIGYEAFYNCSSLTSVTIPEGVTIIDGDAFSGCCSLTSVTIPEGVTSIRGGAFAGCSSLTSVTIPEGVTSIDYETFRDCSNLTSVTIPESVTSICEQAFCGCSSLTSVTIPEGVTSIGGSAFSGCNKLSKILLPASVNSIGDSAIPYGATIYCYEYTYADDWATENNRSVVYLDGGITDDMRMVELSFEKLSLPCGESKQVVANIFPAIDVGGITWTSSSPTVASVENGLITALAPGKTTITIAIGTISDSVEVTTFVRATGFAIPEEVWFVAKESVILPVTDIQPEGAELVLTWSSGDTSLVQVDQNGTVTSNRPDNDVTITVTTDNGISRQCVAHVCYPVTGIMFSEDEVTMREIDRVRLTANVQTRTRNYINRLATFTSANESVAKVDENGRVTAMGPGKTTITATAASGISASVAVTVEGTHGLLRLPADLKTIEDEAFMNLACEAVIIPEGCTAIGARAFANCEALTYVRIPASVKDIAANAFEGCDKVFIDQAN